MKMIKKGLILAVGIMALGSSVSAASITNGSFEDPDINTGFLNYGIGSTDITGWTVGSGSVDIVDTFWIAADGDQAIDLDGSAVGSIYQDISGLVIGASYIIDFFMSGNAAGSPVVKTMDVSVGAKTSSYSFDTALGTAAAGDWAPESFSFVAAAVTERLTFLSTSTNGSFFGPAIDNVSISNGSISPVPVPAAGLLLAGALGGLGLMRRRKNS